MPDTSDIVLTGFPTREQALASGVVLRVHIVDGIVSLADLKVDGLWEEDPVTSTYHKRTPEFFLARAETEEALVQQQKDAEIALAAAMISLEGDLPPQRDGKWSAIADNWQPYATVASEHIPVGCRAQGCKTSAEAIVAWKRAILGYAATRRGDVLWWRIPPEILGRVDFGETEARWIVYSRLMIGNEADTTLARISAGTLRPTKAMIDDKVVTAEQLAELGWLPDKADGWPVLSKFDAEKLPEDAKRAFASVIESLPPIVNLPDALPRSLFHLSTSFRAPTLSEAITGWGKELRRQIEGTNPTRLWWRVGPFGDNQCVFDPDGKQSWVVYSRCFVVLSE